MSEAKVSTRKMRDRDNYINDRENVHKCQVDNQYEDSSVKIHNAFLIKSLIPVNNAHKQGHSLDWIGYIITAH